MDSLNVKKNRCGGAEDETKNRPGGAEDETRSRPAAPKAEIARSRKIRWNLLAQKGN